MNLGEALRVASEKFKVKKRYKYQDKYREKKMKEPGWWARQLQMQNKRRRNNGVS
jgi:hypothetical protein